MPGGSKRNLKKALAVSEVADGVSEARRVVLADAQTSGGLLLCVPGERAEEAVRRLRDAGCERAGVIGGLVRRGEGGVKIRVR